VIAFDTDTIDFEHLDRRETGGADDAISS